MAKASPAHKVQPPPVARTASGRQRRPTEKANYQTSESQHVTQRHEDKEKKLEKRRKKELRAAYQANPDVFEQEPSALHSDADREEDTMFSDQNVHTKLSNTRGLTFSTRKIPSTFNEAYSTRKFITNNRVKTNKVVEHRLSVMVAPSESSDDNSGTAPDDISTKNSDNESVGESDGTSGEDDNAAGHPTLAASGIKRPLDTSLEDAMMPKVRKNSDGSRQRIKASDFDDITKEILVTAGSIFRCLIVTQAPFPDTLIIETKLAKEAWHESCQIKGVNVKLTPSLVKIILRRTSHVRGELKTKMRSLTSSFFGFRTSESKKVIMQNRDLAERLKNGSLFAFKDWESKTGIYKTELIQSGINLMWFINRNDEGVIYHKYFNPLPVEVIALVLAVIECCIDEWATGLKEDVKFTSAAYASVYHDHLDSLRRFEERTAPYKLLEKIRINLHDTARFHAGVEPLVLSSAISRISDEAFEDAIREHQLEEGDESED